MSNRLTWQERHAARMTMENAVKGLTKVYRDAARSGNRPDYNVTAATITPAHIDAAVAASTSDQGVAEGYDTGWTAVMGGYYEKQVCGLPYEVAQAVGGGEGDGERMHVVLKFGDGDEARYFKRCGHYASFDGSTWDGYLTEEVFPAQKTVTVYNTKGA